MKEVVLTVAEMKKDENNVQEESIDWRLLNTYRPAEWTTPIPDLHKLE